MVKDEKEEEEEEEEVKERTFRASRLTTGDIDPA